MLTEEHVQTHSVLTEEHVQTHPRALTALTTQPAGTSDSHAFLRRLLAPGSHSPSLVGTQQGHPAAARLDRRKPREPEAPPDAIACCLRRGTVQPGENRPLVPQGSLCVPDAGPHSKHDPFACVLRVCSAAAIGCETPGVRPPRHHTRWRMRAHVQSAARGRACRCATRTARAPRPRAAASCGAAAAGQETSRSPAQRGRRPPAVLRGARRKAGPRATGGWLSSACTARLAALPALPTPVSARGLLDGRRPPGAPRAARSGRQPARHAAWLRAGPRAAGGWPGAACTAPAHAPPAPASHAARCSDSDPDSKRWWPTKMKSAVTVLMM